MEKKQPGGKTDIYHESKLVRVPIELVEHIEGLLKMYRNQRTFLLNKLRKEVKETKTD